MAALAPFVFICLWSGAFIASRSALPDISPLFLLTVRFAIAGSLLALVLLVWQARRWGELRGRWGAVVVAGAMMNGGYLGAAHIAMGEISGATMALVGSLQPVLVAALSGPLLGDRFRPLQWLGFVLGTAGVALVAGINTLTLDTGPGIAWAVAAVAFMVAGTLIFSRYGRGAPAAHANAVQLLTGAVVCGIWMALAEDVFVEWNAAVVGAMLYAIFGVSLGGMGLYLFMLNRGTAGKVAANFYLTPGLTAIFGFVLLGETLSPLALVGFGAAMVGIWLVQGRTGPASRT